MPDPYLNRDFKLPASRLELELTLLDAAEMLFVAIAGTYLWAFLEMLKIFRDMARSGKEFLVLRFSI